MPLREQIKGRKSMGKHEKPFVIGIDHGYGLIKTANREFSSGLTKMAVMPPFTHNILNYEGNIYAVGQVRQNHKADKTANEDYYLLTLVAIAEELKRVGTNHMRDMILAVGLPYSFMSTQMESFKSYLLKNRNISFTYEGIQYRVEVADAYVFPQGFPILSEDLEKYAGRVSAVDIGSRTIDVLTFQGGRPQYDKCFSMDKGGVIDCIQKIKDGFTAKYQIEPEEYLVQSFLMGNKPGGMSEEQNKFMESITEMYVQEVLAALDAKNILDFATVVYCGGGAGILKRFGDGKYDENNSKFITDIHANARGYERLCRGLLK